MSAIYLKKKENLIFTVSHLYFRKIFKKIDKPAILNSLWNDINFSFKQNAKFFVHTVYDLRR
jgi:hypothetical protein